ncbi:MAG: hypothetical protein U0V72_04495 [Cytophagales bacterium]
MKNCIQNPCFENWNQMENVPEGKYCSHCKHNVIDFTQKTESEIQSIIIGNSSQQRICGLFYKDQLENTVKLSFWEKLSIRIKKSLDTKISKVNSTFIKIVLGAVSSSLVLSSCTKGKVASPSPAIKDTTQVNTNNK